VQRLTTLIACVVLATVLLAGCGSSKKSSTTVATTAADNTIYERAYTECASTSLSELKGKYKVARPTIDSISKAVGAAWSDRYQGGAEGTKIGESGCRDGYNSRPHSSSSA
jgi:outer membrane murein-binding lipoprotein Lpp